MIGKDVLECKLKVAETLITSLGSQHIFCQPLKVVRSKQVHAHHASGRRDHGVRGCPNGTVTIGVVDQRPKQGGRWEIRCNSPLIFLCQPLFHEKQATTMTAKLLSSALP